MKQQFHVITYGCQMNKSDSERIAGLLVETGWQAVETPIEADLVVLNTCSVRQSAENRVFGQVNNLVKLKQTKPDLIIAITGCMPGRDKNGALKKKMPGVDLYFPIIDLPKLPEMLVSFLVCHSPIQSGNPAIKSNFVDNWIPAFAGMTINESLWSIAPLYASTHSALVPIQTGCNNFCSYCVVPYARGREQNRPLKQILTEIQALARKDCLAVTLLGQVVNHYQAPDADNFSPTNPFKNHFAALLWEINQIEGLRWIHFIAPDPQFMNDEIVQALTLPKQMNYLHLPVQSGSDKILRLMNRRYTREDYLKIIEKIRELKPSIALGTDIIVGFPGETEADFDATVNLYKKADFDIAYLAQYSPRSGTAAFKLTDDVKWEEKERRWRVLQEIMEKITFKKNQAFVGKEAEVLVDKSCSLNHSPRQFLNSGQSLEMKLVEFTSPNPELGKIVKVKINKAEEWRLLGD